MVQSWPCPILGDHWITLRQCEAMNCTFKCEVRDLMKPLYGKEDVDVDMAEVYEALLRTKYRIEFENHLRKGEYPVNYAPLNII